jgi:hypothetical protein
VSDIGLDGIYNALRDEPVLRQILKSLSALFVAFAETGQEKENVDADMQVLQDAIDLDASKIIQELG